MADPQIPHVYRICTGYAAAGEGWAVHGPTREAALDAYQEALVRHAIIDARPLPPVAA